MKQEHIPMPDIARLPGEPKLSGVPHRTCESVFSLPGVADAIFLAVDTLDMNSAERRKRLQELDIFSVKRIEDLTEGLRTLADEQVNKSTALRNQGRYLLTLVTDRAKQESGPKTAWEQNPAIGPAWAQVIREGKSSSSFTSVAEEVSQFALAKEHKRQNLLAEKARVLFDNPWKMSLELTILDIYSNTEGEALADDPFTRQINEFYSAFEATLKDMAGSAYFEIPPRKQLHDWLVFASGAGKTEKGRFSESLMQDLALKHLRGFVMDRSEEPEDIIDTVHKIAQAGIITGNKEVTDFTCQILYGQTSILPMGTPQYIDMRMGSLYTEGESRAKSLELMKTRREITVLSSGLSAPKLVIQERALRKEETYKAHLERRKRERAPELRRLKSNPEELSLVKKYLLSWRHNLKTFRPSKRINNGEEDDDLGIQGPIIEHVREVKSALWARKFTPKNQVAHISLNGESQYVKRPASELSGYVREQCMSMDKQTLEQRRAWRTAAYLLPEGITRDQLLTLEKQTGELTRSMKDEQVHSISPRGDQIDIEDDMLSQLGFKNVLYKLNRNDKTKMDIAVTVGNLTFKAQLSKDFELTGIDEVPLYLPEAGNFIKHVVLSHLHEVLCTDNVGETSEDGDLIEQRKAFSSRRAHRRILQLGEKPQPHHVVDILDIYGIDLDRRNRDRVARGEPSLITWVSEVESIAIGGEGPVVSKAPNATSRLHGVLG